VGDLVVVRAVGEPEKIRYGLVAGRGIGKAVLRNRAKRRLRQAVLLADLTPGFDYVLIAGESIAGVSFDDLVDWLREGSRPQVDRGTFEAAN
jgi:ribonuclease P protein component